jgi:hypothetical protein
MFTYSRSDENYKNDTPKLETLNSEQYDEFMESIKVKLNHAEGIPQSIRNSLQIAMNTNRQNFYIKNSGCISDEDQLFSDNSD